MPRKLNSKAAGWIVAAILGALLAWYVFSDTPLRLGDRSLRVYDVNDLIVDIPDFRFDHGGEAEEDERTREQRVRQIAEQVRAHVAPGTWDRDDVISFAEGHRLLIVTSDAKHRLVRDFFDQLRAARRVQVTVEGRFITIGDGSSGQVDEALTRATGEAEGPVFLNDAQVNSLLRAAQASPKATIVTAPRITLYNGQRAYALVATQQAYVSDLTARQAADGSAMYDSKIDIADSGIVFEARATASDDRRHVTLYLHPRLTDLLGMDDLRVGVDSAGIDLTVQRPRMWTAEIHKTVTVPDGQTLLIRNILKPRDAPPVGEAAAAEGFPEEVVLLVKATVIDPSRPAGAVAPATGPSTAPAGNVLPTTPAE